MLLLRLERINDEYILRIPKSEIVQHDLHEGQILAVVVEAFDEFGAIGAETTEHRDESWKLNESGELYDASRTDL
jgi:hypothetical protein